MRHEFSIEVPGRHGVHGLRRLPPGSGPVTFGRAGDTADLWISEAASVSAVAGAFVWANGMWWLANPHGREGVGRARLRAAAADHPTVIELASGGAVPLWNPHGAVRVLTAVREEDRLPRLVWYDAPVEPWPDPVAEVLGMSPDPTGTVDLRPVRQEIIDALAVMTWPARHWSSRYFLTFKDVAMHIGVVKESTVRSWITRDYAQQIMLSHHVPAGNEARHAICNLIVDARVISVEDDLRVEETYGEPPQRSAGERPRWAAGWSEP